VLYCFTQQTLGRLFDGDRWTLVSYRPAIKWISIDHGLSLLEYEAKNSKLAGILRAARRSFLARIDVPYCLGDLAVAVFRRTTASVVRVDWNVAAPAREPVLSPAVPAG
jgi:hypothetical protein